MSEYPPAPLTGPSAASAQTPRRNITTVADFWKSFFSHRRFFEDIGNGFTRGDIRLAFSLQRAVRGKWLEEKVLANGADLEAMWDKVDAHTVDFLEPNAQRDAEGLLERIDRDLNRYSKAHRYDREAAEAPRASRFYLDAVTRYNILAPKGGVKCPNGQAQDFFGKLGEPPKPEFIAIRETEQSLFSYVITKWLMTFYYDILYHPARNFVYKVLGKPVPETEENQGMRRKTHDVLLAGFEASLSCAYMAGSIALSVNVSSQTHRLIFMSIMNLVFLLTVIFLSSRGMHMFVLCAAFWAVTVTLIPRGSP
ncbi:hypothetical protein DM02DRAFT_635288 [Periconia macrospinosa]|uniref:DUF6594 domain-containing protein n=1 Tax=Periconia macrospinosa TaxID=97972 RepID=A0A2V1D395_9PLEO|nr:hypothetical protein DM02DRAFT_635288 [Periconia macrospinosa]